MQLPIARTLAELQAALEKLRRGDEKPALVPTMGALHGGHRELIRAAKASAEKVAVSIFVNPLQFGPDEDFERYPRPFDQDVRVLEEENVHLLYAPTVQDMYPPGFNTLVRVKGASEGMEGARRPGHFDGVATVVAKLFSRLRPDMAFFGEKDYQQLTVIRRLATDMDLPVKIIGVPTRREESGLAMSSRNAYLSPAERDTAAALYRVLNETADEARAGKDIGEALRRGTDKLRAAGFSQVDYLELRDAATLQPVARLEREARLLAAARLGTTRLIDNIEVRP